MSDLMLHGVLNMPLPDDPAECDIVTWVQFKARVRQASDRIEELEAKLAKAVGSLEDMCAEFRGYDLPYGSKAYTKATATLAELKGQNDGTM